MIRRRSLGAALAIAVLVLSVYGCTRELPTSSAGAAPRPLEGGLPTRLKPGSAVIILVPQAIASIRKLPELGILDGGGTDGDVQSYYFKTTDMNREFRRGFAEFAIPGFSDGFVSARLVLRETRATIAPPVPADRHELSTYTDVDLNVTTSDFDRPTSALATFETDANLDPQSFAFDVSSLVAQSQGARLGFRVKLEVDPGFTGFGFLGTDFSGSATPPGFRLEVTTTVPAAIDHLQDVIRQLDLPESASARLLAPLERAERVLRDDVPSNDQAACPAMDAFLREVDTAEQSGLLSAQSASQLQQLAQSIRAGTGCPEGAA